MFCLRCFVRISLSPVVVFDPGANYDLVRVETCFEVRTSFPKYPAIKRPFDVVPESFITAIYARIKILHQPTHHSTYLRVWAFLIAFRPLPATPPASVPVLLPPPPPSKPMRSSPLAPTVCFCIYTHIVGWYRKFTRSSSREGADRG